MGTGPAIETGHDLAVTELLDGDRHDLLVSAGSERGQAVLAELQEQVDWRPAGEGDLEDERNLVTASVDLDDPSPRPWACS